jgi:uncharacterized membrane protein
MPAWLNGMVRAALQAAWAWLAVFVAAKLGVELPADVPAVVELFVSAAVLAAVVAVVQRVERLDDSSVVGRLLRMLVRWAMLGARPAVYPRLPEGYVPPKA